MFAWGISDRRHSVTLSLVLSQPLEFLQDLLLRDAIAGHQAVQPGFLQGSEVRSLGLMANVNLNAIGTRCLLWVERGHSWREAAPRRQLRWR